jgi:hypothetical protein
MSDFESLRENEMLSKAASMGLDEEVISYAKQIQRQLSAEGDEALWIDCLEMSYNELIINRL